MYCGIGVIENQLILNQKNKLSAACFSKKCFNLWATWV